MAVSVAIGYQADTHQLITVQFLLTAQAADSFLIRIVGMGFVGNIDGWFHTVLKRDCEGTIPEKHENKLGKRVYHADSKAARQSLRRELRP